MSILYWIEKDKVIRLHTEVAFRFIESLSRKLITVTLKSNL